MTYGAKLRAEKGATKNQSWTISRRREWNNHVIRVKDARLNSTVWKARWNRTVQKVETQFWQSTSLEQLFRFTDEMPY